MKLRILFLELPSPPGMNVIKDPFGGFGRVFPSRRKRYGFDRDSFTVFPPIFPAYAAAILEEKGFNCSILDAQIHDLNLPELMQEVRKRKPDIVVTRISFQAFEEDLQIISKIKDDIPTITAIGWGPVCKVLPFKALASDELDVIVRDELEFALPKVIEKIGNKQDLVGVLGIAFRSGENVVSNLSLPFTKNLDVLPIASYHLLDMEKYVTKGTSLFPRISKEGFRYSCMYSSRGCSYNCMYCANPVIFGPWRAMSPKRTVDEIEFLINNYNVQAIRFMDSCFNMDNERVEAICDEIVNRNLDVFWTCEVRAEKLGESILRKMKKAGCIDVEIGVETGDTELLENVGKRGSSLEHIKKAFKLARETGISTRAFIMVGLPGESWKAVQNTKRLLSQIKPDDVSVSIVTPFPDTPLYKMAEENGWLLTSDWRNYTAIDPVMNVLGFSCEDTKKAHLYLSDYALARQGIREISRSLRELKFITASKQVISGLRHVCNVVECKLKGRD